MVVKLDMAWNAIGPPNSPVQSLFKLVCKSRVTL